MNNENPDYIKAKRDWTTVQQVADRRFVFEKSKRAYIQTQAARITHNIDELCRLAETDAYFFSDTVIGRWPYA